MMINILPNGWKIEKLGSICRIVYGKGLPTKNLKSKGFPVFGANGIIGFNDKYLYEEPMVLISCRGAYSGKINVSPPKSFVTNNSLILNIKSKEEVDRTYLYYALISSNKEKLVTGTAQPQVTINNAIEISIPVPPLLIQKQIVSKIEELFSELDKGIENLKLAQAQLKVYRQVVLKWAFEGRLTNDNVKEGQLPPNWKEIKFGELFSESPQNGLYKPSTEYGFGTPIIRIDGFYDGRIVNDYNFKRLNTTSDELNRFQISVGDILVNRVNSMPYLGKCGIVKYLKEPTVFESNIMKVKLKEEIALPELYTMYLSSKKGINELRKNAKQAVNQASINQTDVSNVLVFFCSIEEQFMIIQSIDSRLSLVDKMEESINQSLLHAEVLRQSILKRAFEGSSKPVISL